jgi:hypothetical protein
MGTEERMQRSTGRPARRLAVLLALVPLVSSGCATPAQQGGAAAIARGGDPRDWGVEPLPIRLSAAGYLLDFRLRVRDRDKAAALLVRKTDCYLIAEKTGGVLQVARSPKIGALRATVRTESMVKQDRVYATLFANPGRLVAPGDRVTVVMGDFRAEHLVVE